MQNYPDTTRRRHLTGAPEGPSQQRPLTQRALSTSLSGVRGPRIQDPSLVFLPSCELKEGELTPGSHHYTSFTRKLQTHRVSHVVACLVAYCRPLGRKEHLLKKELSRSPLGMFVARHVGLAVGSHGRPA